MRHRCSTLTLALCAALFAAGCDSALTPTQPEPPPEGLEPAFLIGQSPLIALIKETNGNLVQRSIEISVDANKGIVESRAEDKFFTRTSVSFSKDGNDVADLGACIQKPEPAKEDALRRGGAVAIVICINIPDTEWAKILAATPAGEFLEVCILMELILIDGAGKVHVLDSTTAEATVDPQTAA